MTRYAVQPPPPNIIVGPASSQMANVTTAWTVANACAGTAFFVSRPVLVSTAYFRVAVQSGNMDIGILDASGNRLASTGSFAVPGTGARSQALTSSVLLLPGRRYYAVAAVDNTTAAVSGHSIGIQPAPPGYILYPKVGSSFPIPASLTLAEMDSAFAIPSLRFA